MNWIIASGLMFLSSVITYLFVRLANNQNIDNSFKNLAMFLIPVIIYLGISTNQLETLNITGYQLLVIIIMSIFFSYLGNKLSLKSIELAPNPGFSLVVSKSYVVFTTLAAIFLFSSPLSIKAALAISLIVVGSALIMIEKRKNNEEQNNLTWFWLALGAFFAGVC